MEGNELRTTTAFIAVKFILLLTMILNGCSLLRWSTKSTTTTTPTSKSCSKFRSEVGGCSTLGLHSWGRATPVSFAVRVS